MMMIGTLVSWLARSIAHGVVVVALLTSRWSCNPTVAPVAAPAPVTPSASSPVAIASPTASEEAIESSDQRDHECEAAIEASLDRVRALVTDYDHYATIMPKFGRSRVIKRGAEGADVYLQVPVLHGAGHLWAMVRFTGPTPTGAGERIEGTYLHEGNVSAFHCAWTLSRIDDTHTLLHLALLLLPKIPLPQSIIDKELNDACRDALGGIKSHAENAPHGSSSGP
jgi:hypothetical protein